MSTYIIILHNIYRSFHSWEKSQSTNL